MGHVCRGTPVSLQLREDRGFTFGGDDLARLLTNATKLVVLDSPSNPTVGASRSKSWLL
ncbi:MAG: hypothetical protein ACC658_17220 [Acidimicrobiia bacterium]